MSEHEVKTIDGTTGKADPPQRRIDLSSLRDVRLEMAYVYRQVDCGKISPSEATKRTYLLDAIHKVIVSAELEQRIIDLEERAMLAQRPGLPPERQRIR